METCGCRQARPLQDRSPSIREDLLRKQDMAKIIPCMLSGGKQALGSTVYRAAELVKPRYFMAHVRVGTTKSFISFAVQVSYLH